MEETAGAMIFNALKKRFSRASARAETPQLPYSYIVNLFGFKSGRYVTEPTKEWEIRQYMGMDTSRRDGWAAGRTFYADPEDKLIIPHPARPDSIYEDPKPDVVRASPAVMGCEDDVAWGRQLIVVIRDRITDPAERGNIVFGLYGARKPDGHIKFYKILVPDINSSNQMVGLRKVDLDDPQDIALALSYARACVETLVNKEEFYPRQILQQLKADPPAVRTLPWIAKTPAP